MRPGPLPHLAPVALVTALAAQPACSRAPLQPLFAYNISRSAAAEALWVGEHVCVARRDRTIHCFDGHTWVTFDGHDITPASPLLCYRDASGHARCRRGAHAPIDVPDAPDGHVAMLGSTPCVVSPGRPLDVQCREPSLPWTPLSPTLTAGAVNAIAFGSDHLCTATDDTLCCFWHEDFAPAADRWAGLGSLKVSCGATRGKLTALATSIALTCGITGGDTIVCDDDAAPVGKPLRSLAASSFGVCALAHDGTVDCFDTSLSPDSRVSSLSGITALACSVASCCAAGARDIWCWHDDGPLVLLP